MGATDYASYELAKKLKACGFDEPCIAQWACEPDGKPMLMGSTAFVFSNAELKGRDVTAPLLYHAQKWLREKGVEVVVEPRFSNYKLIGYDWMCYDDRSGDYALRAPLPFSNSYEAALSAGISSALDLLAGKEDEG